MCQQMSALVDTAFLDWTESLDPRQALISVFKHIRDIPYSVAIPMRNPTTAPEQILELGKGSCSPKHYLLAEMCRMLGYEAAFATFPFLWNDPDLRYPPGLRQLATGLPVAYHLACRIMIGGRWVLVDATWDPPLKSAGFPVNENWDGVSDTKCAVKPLISPVRTAFCRTATNEPCRSRSDSGFFPVDGEEDHRDVEGHLRSSMKRTIIGTPDEIGRIRSFYQEFEIWLDEIRRQA
jgi:hypothetical protein